ncbi:rhodanese-like domain-containing protein [Caenibacillus caldisaponilyticus]|jgi:rhodanese-related sulfurtransferase|uniref:rhodanese-like domain-containing protein n=1 Tax=Caenibacillus caldisaponilyticus TaxID=1674942 RepID=UPI001EE6FF03|nr:rhodanese-like domain-containing protein [Caenibacillus caldisaponilyticus]
MEEDIQSIEPQALEARLAQNDPELVVIDVREDEEVATGMIPGATHIRLGDLPERYEELDPEKTYVMVCRSGRRSLLASQFMAEKGFKVINMEGGMIKWTGEIRA